MSNGELAIVDHRHPPLVEVKQTGAQYPIEIIRPKENLLSVVVRKDGNFVRYRTDHLNLVNP